MLETIKFEKEGNIGIVTLNRPEAMNAFSLQLTRELRQVIDEIDADENILVYIITGKHRADGRPCFCAGADIKEKKDEMMDRVFRIEINDCFNKIQDMLKPSIAAVDGVATAGGNELALACDLRIVSTTAQVSDLHLKNTGQGIGGAGSSTRLCRTVGMAKAKELILRGMIIDGNEACRIGWANQVVPPEKLLSESKKIAKEIAAMNPFGVKLTLAQIEFGVDMDFYQQLRFGTLMRGAIMGPLSAKEEDRRGNIAGW